MKAKWGTYPLHHIQKTFKLVLIEREPRFLSVDGVLRLNASNPDAVDSVGKAIGQFILASFRRQKPVRGIYLYGGYGSGKTRTANAILQGFQNADGVHLESKTRQNLIESTFPKFRHIDYWLAFQSPVFLRILPEYAVPRFCGDEVLAAEWCLRLPETYFCKDRIEIEMVSGRSVKEAVKSAFYFMPSVQKGQKHPPPDAPDAPARIMSIACYGEGRMLLSDASFLNEAQASMLKSEAFCKYCNA